MYTLLISLRLAWRTLMQNKVRSALTLLGMIIGVGAVISIVSLGEGLRAEFEGSISEMGTDVLYMAPSSPRRPGQAPGRMRLFKMDDMDAIEECESIDYVLPGIIARVQAKYLNKVQDVQVMGGYPDWLARTPSESLESGRWVTDGDLRGANRVVVIGHELSEELFEDWEDPVDKRIKLDGVTYTIIGKLAERSGGVFQGGPNTSMSFLAPISTVQKRMLSSEDVFWVTMDITPGYTLAQAKEEVAVVMRQRRQIRNAADDNFQFISPDDFADMANQFVNILIGIFGAIAFISLLVGGVGIMNIMLVSVTERTREIGLRLAVGATGRVVLTQFLVEAIVLTLIGGIIGMLTGFIGAFGLSVVLESALNASWKPTIPANWVAYSVGVSVLVGVVFGVYPAFKASQLDPVEAMRYE